MGGARSTQLARTADNNKKKILKNQAA